MQLKDPRASRTERLYRWRASTLVTFRGQALTAEHLHQLLGRRRWHLATQVALPAVKRLLWDLPAEDHSSTLDFELHLRPWSQAECITHFFRQGNLAFARHGRHAASPYLRCKAERVIQTKHTTSGRQK